MKNTCVFTTHTEAELRKLGGVIAARYTPQLRLFGFSGVLGAGKTTLIKGFTEQLGIRYNITSPTFSLLQEYPIPTKKLRLVHIDLYRIQSENELAPIGVFEAIEDPFAIVCIEWYDRFPKIFSGKKHLQIVLKTKKRARTITTDIQK